MVQYTQARLGREELDHHEVERRRAVVGEVLGRAMDGKVLRLSSSIRWTRLEGTRSISLCVLARAGVGLADWSSDSLAGW
jgi:hypothetical protein